MESKGDHVLQGLTENHERSLLASVQYAARLIRDCDDILTGASVNYVEAAMGTPPSREVQNPAGRKLDRESIASLVEWEAAAGGPTDEQGMVAAACELADRTHNKVWAPILDKVIYR